MKQKFLTAIIALAVMVGTGVSAPLHQVAHAQTFSDVPSTNPYYSSIEALVASGVLQGYPDGTFKPNQPVNRAEAIKMVLTGIGDKPSNGLYNTGFTDVPLDVWYAGYVFEGALKGIIHGNPDGTFAGSRTVNKAEFLKMTEQAFQVDLSPYQNITGNIAADVPAGTWFTPYVGYAKAVGLIYATVEDTLSPEKLLTRGECAQILHKMMYVKQGGYVQERLSMAEASIIDALLKVYRNDIDGAVAQAGIALERSEEALNINPESETVQATHLLAEAFQKLFQAYKAGTLQSYAHVVLYVNEAKSLADQAVEVSSSAQYFATQVHEHGDSLLSQVKL
ncbi:MAG: S-layer homology domain-containing protein [Candidatus Gracilibacteria bacterium]|nr:S-layer homology domain-containing protein [Candidatus Peregrinibacteria bacterium]